MATVVFDARMGAFVLHQILLAEERLRTLRAIEWSWTHLVRSFVRFKSVFRSKVLAALLTDVGSGACMGVNMLFQKVAAAVPERIIVYKACFESIVRKIED